MRNAILATTLLSLALAGSSIAQQTPVPTSPFNRTFAGSLTRGYYFQTPIDLTITGLQVPDETGHGLQNVEVFRMATAPLAFPGTGTGVQVFYATGLPSSRVIPTNLHFRAGDWIGILGACGDATTIYNSYGPAGGYATNVLGHEVTIKRLLTQTNIVASGGDQPYSSEDNFEVGRIHTWVKARAADLHMPAFQSTYSSPSQTRGFYFQTPIDFTINGLRVPDETGHGLQNVEVYRMSTEPPAYSTTGTGGRVFLSVGELSSSVIPCNIPFQAGDWVGILGACGDGTRLYNSYGPSGGPVTSLLGQPVTLHRFLTQTNLASSGGDQPYSGIQNSTIARIEVHVAGNVAQSPFARTFSSASLSRGYYFQAPTNFRIVGLRVPDESGHGYQSVEVIRLATAPPAWPLSGTGGSVFYASGLPSGLTIPCNIPFRTGEWVCVLGACGDTTMMHSSYGGSLPTADLFGHTITMDRFLTQTNLAAGGNQAYSTETGGSVGRVEMLFARTSASSLDYGVGAGVANPAPILTTPPLSEPVIGGTGTLEIENFDPANAGGALLYGLGRAEFPFANGNLLVNPLQFWIYTLPVAPLPVGVTSLPFPIPPLAMFEGVMINLQVGVIVLPPDVALTNGTEWIFGI